MPLLFVIFLCSYNRYSLTINKFHLFSLLMWYAYINSDKLQPVMPFFRWLFKFWLKYSVNWLIKKILWLHFFHQVTEKQKRKIPREKNYHIHKLASFSLMIGIHWQKAEEVKCACHKIWLEHFSCIFHILSRWQRWSSGNCSPIL